MPEASDAPAPYGMLAEFASSEALTEAARRTRAAGYRRLDAFTPFPVEELPEALGIREGRIGPVFFLGGLAGLSFALAVMWYTNIDYPIEVGGRPVFAFPAFMVVAFELTILCAVLFGTAGMLVLNRLPKLHHPVYGAERFGFASDDRFFLCVMGDDPRFSETDTRAFLATLDPRTIQTVQA